MEERKYKVYIHEFPNGKVYVGLTSCNIDKRWGNCGNGYKYQLLMWRAIQKYGWDNIIHDILAVDLTKEEAEQMEVEWIGYYNSTDKEFGYNVREGGNTSKLSQETKLKMSELRKGKYEGSKNPFYNKQHSEKTKQLISKKAKDRYKNGQIPSMLGKHLSDETKQKIREKHIGKKMDEETKLKIKNTRDCKQVVQLNKCNRELIKTHRSMLDASKELGIPVPNIVENCKHKRKSAGGFVWMYLDEYKGGATK